VTGNSVLDVNGPQDPSSPVAAVFALGIFAQATDGYFYRAGFCSATLVKSDAMVSASHCVRLEEKLRLQAAHDYGVSFPNNPALHLAVLSPGNNHGTCNAEVDPPDCVSADPCASPSQLPPRTYGKQAVADACVSSVEVDPRADYHWGPHDVALLFLDREIPLSLAWPVRTAVSNEPVGVQYGTATTVGFGTDTQDENWPSMRREGFIPNLEVGFLDISAVTEGQGWAYQSERVPEETDLIEQGDSGGALFGGGQILVGVTSGWYDSNGIWAHGEYIGEGIYQVWAPLYPWLLNYLDNADNDRIRDSVDNCPAWRCKNSADCSNFFQEDSDGDGIGDVCDNCPPAFCANNGLDAFYCYNPPWPDPSGPQDDMDGDGIGDRCDPCPNDNSDVVVNRDSVYTSYSWKLLSDDDGDGIGNACDLCRGTVGHVARCHSNADCPDHRCVGLAETSDHVLWGRCVSEADADHDKVGDDCDACPFTPDRPDLPNSNDVAEIVQHAEPLPDACDEAPVARLDVPTWELKPGTLKLPSEQGTGAPGPFEIAAVGASSTLGAHDPGDPPNPYTSSVEFRVCNCYYGATGQTRAMKACVLDPGAPCGSPDPWANLSGFWEPSMAELYTLTPLSSPPIPSLTFEVGQTRNAEPMAWMWWNDSNRPDTAGSWYTNAQGFRAANVVIVSRVNRGATPVTLRSGAVSERDASVMVRYSYAMADVPRYEVALPVPPLASRPQKVCLGGGCFLIVRPDVFDPRLVSPEPNQLSKLFFYMRTGGLAFVADGRLVGARPGAAPTDLTPFVPASLRDRVADGDMIFAAPVEAGRELRRSWNRLEGVVLPRSWSSTSAITTINATPNGLQLGSDVLPDDSVPGARSMSSMAGGLSSPGDRIAPAAVLSVRSGAVFLVGGTRDSGVPTREIWRYSMLAESWSRVALGAAHPPEHVLGATYDPDTNTLYVLDELRPKHGLRWARLIAYDTRAGSSRVLHQWPRLGRFKTLRLVLDGAHQLVLVAARPQRVELFRFSIAHPSTPLIGLTDVAGELLDTPFVTDDGILVPVIRKNKVEVIVAKESDFGGGLPCSAL